MNIYICVYFWDTVSLNNPGWPGTPYGDQAGLQFLDGTVSDSKYVPKELEKYK